jgi:RNA polymerase sigma-B factor
VRKSVQALSQTSGGRSPSVAAIAEHSKLTEEEVRLGMEAMQSYSSLSLDAEMSSTTRGGYSLLDTLGATETAYQQVVRRETVKPCLRRLPERERRILYLRYYRDMTQSRIADQLGISQMHVSRLLSRILTDLRERLYDYAEPAS